MKCIRQANLEDLTRIIEIYIFNYRLYFYPIFKNDEYYFKELQVTNLNEQFSRIINQIYVYDDGVVKGFIQINHQEVIKLFVEPVLQNNNIGSKLLENAMNKFEVNSLWVLEKNIKAIHFYNNHGFNKTHEKRYEEGTNEYLVRLQYTNTN